MTTVITYSICIVDDDQDLRELLKIALESKYQVRAFPAARPAIEAVEKDPPDLVILEIGLPDMSGIDALRTMRDRHPDLMVIMATAFTDVKLAISSSAGARPASAVGRTGAPTARST